MVSYEGKLVFNLNTEVRILAGVKAKIGGIKWQE